jgi:hypothetical protein
LPVPSLQGPLPVPVPRVALGVPEPIGSLGAGTPPTSPTALLHRIGLGRWEPPCEGGPTVASLIKRVRGEVREGRGWEVGPWRGEARAWAAWF